VEGIEIKTGAVIKVNFPVFFLLFDWVWLWMFWVMSQDYPSLSLFFCVRFFIFPLMILKKGSKGNPNFPAYRAGRAPWTEHHLCRPSMRACHHFCVFALYCVMQLEFQYIRLQQVFIMDALNRPEMICSALHHDWGMLGRWPGFSEKAGARHA
jgi:hypothetical protein